jgi:predicted RND superfamily exporter protein
MTFFTATHSRTARPDARPMSDLHQTLAHAGKGCAWLFASIGMSGGVAKLAAMGWTPQSLLGLIGALATLTMAVANLVKACQPYFDRLMDARKARR